ncbi:unnamed protein product [Cylindrotheca closterium]|uniref:Uncharacterized protein n=1 Tax=Cylindrotheca closterium TaxID=2856 RepID=A0AAD2GBL2_9STRA|nr:unnamed protein product [Cylindrotheca closterium]
MISRQPLSPPSLLVSIGSIIAALVLSSSIVEANDVSVVNVNSNANRSLQGQPYEYTSDHIVARASAISKDYQTIVFFLAQDNGAGRENARAVYQLGAYCQSYATLMLDAPLTSEILQGTEVTGTNANGDSVSGIVHSGAFSGDATLEVMYLIPSDGIANLCSVAGNPTPQYEQCLNTSGEISVSGGPTLTYSNYDLDNDTAAGQSIQSMSMTISGAGTLGYPRIGTFASYYGTNRYANEFIQAAFDKADTQFDSGNAEFTKWTQFGTKSFITVATLTMSSWMHIIIKMQDAVEVCKSLPQGQKSVQEVPLWDNAVATYRGMGGAAGGTMGQLWYLADNYCQKFGTCQDGPGGSQGIAKANSKLYAHFNAGKQDLLDGNCDLAESSLDAAATTMTIPIIQGLLYHAYELDLFQEQREIVQGEAAAFLHSLLPLVHACSGGNAVMIYNEIKVGNGKTASFEAIKTSLEGTYECLGVSCEDIGGIVDLADPTTYLENGAPCGTLNVDDQDGDGIPDVAPVVPANPQPSPTQRPSSLPGQAYEYTSDHVNSRTAAISKDFESIARFLSQQTGAARESARAIYQLGAYCQSYATLQLDGPLNFEISQGTEVTGTNNGLGQVNAVLYRDAFPGDTTVEVMYLIPSDGVTNICSVAGNSYRCFMTTGVIAVAGGGGPLSYTGYDADVDTANGLSLRSMSSTISEARTLGYPRIGTYAANYGTNKYADEFIRAAFGRIDTAFDNFNAEFTKFSQFGTNKFIEVATLTMSSWMHIVIKMQDAIEICKSLPNGQKSVEQVPHWDDAVAIYRGLGGGGSTGQLSQLANQYCARFGTCQDGTGGTQGIAKANAKVYAHFKAGKQDLLDGRCDLVENSLDEVATAMTIPLIQGLLYHAYELDLLKEQREVAEGAAAAFLHSVLPLLHACSEGIAVMVYNQIKVGNGKTASFEIIKASLESQYECLGVTCEDIGGIMDLSNPIQYQRNSGTCVTFDIGDGIPNPEPSPTLKPTLYPTSDDSDPTDPPSSRFIESEDSAGSGVSYCLGLAIGLSFTLLMLLR